jgi:pimeloyl-ACP methyl ester carboxylesterase
MILAHDIAGDGPLVVLIHGITERREAWDPVDLTDSFTVLRVDMRGHGESEVAPPYDPATLAGDVHETVEAVRPGEVPLVVGHSMGAIVSTAYGALYPTAGVVNIDQPIEPNILRAQVGGAAAYVRASADAPPAPEPAEPPVFDDGPLPAGSTARLVALRELKPEVVFGMWGPLLDGEADLDQGVEAWTRMRDDAPYLVLTGHDQGEEYVAWLTATIPTTVHEVWGPATHYPHLIDPARFAERIQRFAATGA